MSRAYIHTYSTPIFSWIFYLLVVSLLLGAFLMFYPRMDAETRDRIRRSEHLMKHCNNHAERDEVLRTPATPLTIEAIKKGTLPCGTPIGKMVRELMDLHRLHPEDGHSCLTAKHLGYPYSVISKLNSDGSVDVMFNPEKVRVIETDKTMEVNVTSDFYPLAAPVTKLRPMSAWISYIDLTGEHQRPRADGKTLHCVLEAYEILTGQHARMFSSSSSSSSVNASAIHSNGM